MRIPTILAAACLMLISCQIEEGCTDPIAFNYDPNADEDNGSCDFGNDPSNYDQITIGGQVWFAENLRTTVYANGDPIASSLTDSEWASANQGATSVYSEGSSDCENFSPVIDACDEAQSLAEYGRLYNWYAVDDARGLCPVGWHVPTDEEWTELEDYITSQGFAGTEGSALKSTTGWTNSPLWLATDNGNGTDDFGFSALPGGARASLGYFDIAGALGYWWSSSPNGGGAFYRNLRYSHPNVERASAGLRYGLSVRCLED